jgi:cellulose biosynthesis protein BcsQ
MAAIVFVSPKSGAGKTTAALLLATQIATSYDVTVIDADPNRPSKAWAAGGNAPRRLSVVSDVDEDNTIESIRPPMSDIGKPQLALVQIPAGRATPRTSHVIDVAARALRVLAGRGPTQAPVLQQHAVQTAV